VVIATSDLHMKHKLQMEPDAVIDVIARSVTHARNLRDDVEWSAEDATRSERQFLRRAIETAIKAGATTINLPDTVGYTYPSEYADLFSWMTQNVEGADKVIFSTHCHNDLGLAVANSLAGVQGGARQIECAINGLGERAGNAALEEVVMALKVRGDKLPFETKIDTTHITRASRYVSAITGFPVQYNKAIVGKNAFAHESGIHQDGMLKNRETYEIMTPESVGQAPSSLVMGKHSGSHAFRAKLKDLGYELGQNALKEAFGRFKDLADRKKHVYDDDIIALVDDALARGSEKIRVAHLRVVAGTEGQSAELTLDVDGQERTAEATGDGPVDAVFNAIHKIVPHRPPCACSRCTRSPKARTPRPRSRCVWKRTAASPPARPPTPTRSPRRPRPMSTRSTTSSPARKRAGRGAVRGLPVRGRRPAVEGRGRRPGRGRFALHLRHRPTGALEQDARLGRPARGGAVHGQVPEARHRRPEGRALWPGRRRDPAGLEALRPGRAEDRPGNLHRPGPAVRPNRRG
jgi:isopropylmalate/homocitrate/citramalate synthase